MEEDAKKDRDREKEAMEKRIRDRLEFIEFNAQQQRMKEERIAMEKAEEEKFRQEWMAKVCCFSSFLSVLGLFRGGRWIQFVAAGGDC